VLGGDRADGSLRTLDDATKVLRQSSKAPTRAPSVSGIGAVIEKPDYSEAKIVVAMVGLPARGKSYLSNRLMRYLRVSLLSTQMSQSA
jgi:6-phosphofructo-2-kinase/fructose-2,6-biphosphatase 2